MTIGETAALSTSDNRLIAHLHAHGIEMEPGEYVVCQARDTRRLARLGYGPEALEATPAFLDRQPELLLDDAFWAGGGRRQPEDSEGEVWAAGRPVDGNTAESGEAAET